MKKQLILALALSTFSLTACEEEYDTLNPAPEPNPVAVLTISSFFPESAACGAAVVISGKNFGASMADNYVNFSGAYAEVTAVYPGIVVVRVPQDLDPGDYTISLSANGQTSASTKFFRVK